MGILDDAIREHLDLKRRRGADPAEIERAEREALGPVRRGPELTGDEPAAPEADPGLETGYPDAEGGAPSLRRSRRRPQNRGSRSERIPSCRRWRSTKTGPRTNPREPRTETRSWTKNSFPTIRRPPSRRTAQTSRRPRARVGSCATPCRSIRAVRAPTSLRPREQETEEYELEPEEEADDDVLESTPEFLQDAPEHDRLWFEQRPPRDFDFDG